MNHMRQSNSQHLGSLADPGRKFPTVHGCITTSLVTFISHSLVTSPSCPCRLSVGAQGGSGSCRKQGHTQVESLFEKLLRDRLQRGGQDVGTPQGLCSNHG